MVPIRQNLVSPNKYSIKCPYDMKPEGMTVHNTANNASAQNEVSYMINNNDKVSFHFAVDDKEIVQGIPENRNAYHASDGSDGTGNRKTISIEICYSTGDKAKFEKAQENTAEFVAYKLKEYKWNIDKVYTHKHWSGKHCPHRTLDDYGWDYFINLVKKYLNDEKNPSTETYKVVTNINKYNSASNAKAQTNSQGKYTPGTYYIFNKYPNGYDGMYNITKDKTGNTPGSWINPSENIIVKNEPVQKKSNIEIAKEVIQGKWGNGDVRKQALLKAGYDYNAVQTEVKKLLNKQEEAPKQTLKSIEEIAKEVLAGKWGNGDARKQALVKAGYDYSLVQNAVNKLLNKPTPVIQTLKPNSEIAKEVLAGKWGNGAERKKKLEAAGYNYSAIQAEVNKLLK